MSGLSCQPLIPILMLLDVKFYSEQNCGQDFWSGWTVDASVLYEWEANPLECESLTNFCLLSLKFERQLMPIRLAFLFGAFVMTKAIVHWNHEMSWRCRGECMTLHLTWRQSSPSASSNKLLFPPEIALIEEERTRTSFWQRWVKSLDWSSVDLSVNNTKKKSDWGQWSSHGWTNAAEKAYFCLLLEIMFVASPASLIQRQHFQHPRRILYLNVFN